MKYIDKLEVKVYNNLKSPKDNFIDCDSTISKNPDGGKSIALECFDEYSLSSMIDFCYDQNYFQFLEENETHIIQVLRIKELEENKEKFLSSDVTNTIYFLKSKNNPATLIKE